MLVLTLKQSQTVRIDDKTTVHFLSLHGGAIRLGFDAPKEVQIQRGALLGIDPPAPPPKAPPIKIRGCSPGRAPWLAGVAVLKAGGTMAEAEQAASAVRHGGKVVTP